MSTENTGSDAEIGARDAEFEGVQSPVRAKASDPGSVSAPDPQDYTLPCSKNPANIEAFDLLEVMLRRMHKREDPSELMQVLRQQMGSAYVMFHQDRLTLQLLGMHRLDAFLFSMIPDITRAIEQSAFKGHPRVGRLAEAAPFLISKFLYLQHERFYLICVNTRGTLKACVLLNKGIEDRALLSIRDLMLEVMRAEPAGVIVAHNHPNRTLRPSNADLQCTMNIINALGILNVPLLDHVIVADRSVISIRENGFIAESVWMNQTPQNHLLRDWFLPPKGDAPARRKVYTPDEKRAYIERQMRIKRNKRKRSMEALISLHRHHTAYAQRYLQKYEKVRRKDEYMKREDVQQSIQRRIDRYMKRYTRVYQLMMEAKEQQKLQKQLERQQKQRRKPDPKKPEKD